MIPLNQKKNQKFALKQEDTRGAADDWIFVLPGNFDTSVQYSTSIVKFTVLYELYCLDQIG